MKKGKHLHSDAADVISRLHELGLRQEVLTNAVNYGVGFGLECTQNDPLSLLGMLVWGKATRSLREQLIPEGWSIKNERNYAKTINPDETLAIVVAAGDANTGLPNRNPATRSDKGPATRDAIRINQGTFADIDTSYSWPVSAVQTWLLLHYLDEDTEEIRSELSFPAEITNEGQVTVWKERIVLPPILFTSTPVTDANADSDDEEIDIDVERRA